MIKYLVRHGVSLVEFGTLSAADAYRTEHGVVGAAEEFDDGVAPPVTAPIDTVALGRKAKLHGVKIQEQFTGENIAMGITQAGKSRLIADACRDVIYYLVTTGSLHEAIAACDEVVLTPEMSPFLTPARVAQFKARIAAFNPGDYE